MYFRNFSDISFSSLSKTATSTNYHLVFVAEKSADEAQQLIDGFNSHNMKLFGGIYPTIFSDEQNYEQGFLILEIPPVEEVIRLSAKDENFFLKWDGVSGVIPSHKEDHTLKLAFKNSTLWFYQEIARRIGLKQMQEIVDKADFGNKKIGDQVDQFWLEGPLKISALEYIEFLKGIHLETFSFDKKNYAKAKRIFIEEETQDYTLRAKTGTTVFNGEQLCWYVGYIERSDNTYFFAMNVSSHRPDNFLEGKAIKSRIPLTLRILKEEFKLI